MNQPSVVHSIAPGDVIAGKYRVERVLGAGGMGIVFAARHLQLEDSVAIKVLLPEWRMAADVVQRFLTEARAARRLTTEHSAKVTDVGTLPESEAPYMVMELLEGSDLSRVLEECGPLPAALAVEYVLQACVAIAEAHAIGIIHRDIKPSNLFLTLRFDGSPCIKVLDFGIAKIAREDSFLESVTRTNSMIGTAVYAAPEQLQSAKDVDARADIWSLGVTLYELLTGKFPFHADNLAALVARILTTPHVPVASRGRELPSELVRAIDRALNKNCAARWPNVAAFAAAIAPFGGGDSARHLATIQGAARRQESIRPKGTGPADEGDEASGTTPPTDPSPFDNRRPARAPKLGTLAWTAAIGLLVVGGIGWLLWSPGRQTPPDPAGSSVAAVSLPSGVESLIAMPTPSVFEAARVTTPDSRATEQGSPVPSTRVVGPAKSAGRPVPAGIQPPAPLRGVASPLSTAPVGPQPSVQSAPKSVATEPDPFRNRSSLGTP